MNVCLLIPSVVKPESVTFAAEGVHPRMDYDALAAQLRQRGHMVELLDYGQLSRSTHPAVKLAFRIGGRDAALAMLGFVQRRKFDAIFTNGENVGIPLALLLARCRKRPGHVTIGHRLSTGKKRLFFIRLKAHLQMDTIFVYASTQEQFARQLGIEASRLSLIPFHADDAFYRPDPARAVRDNQISAAGLEWRDYPTLISAVKDFPDLAVRLAAASPWSKHVNETERQSLPPNVDARRYDYAALRELYGQSAFVVVPLYENDFQAGVTTLLEAMAMGKAVICTRTTGQTDVVEDGITGVYVPPGDAGAWKAAIQALRNDVPRQDALGRQARQWVQDHASLDRWVATVSDAIEASATH